MSFTPPTTLTKLRTLRTLPTLREGGNQELVCSITLSKVFNGFLMLVRIACVVVGFYCVCVRLC